MTVKKNIVALNQSKALITALLTACCLIASGTAQAQLTAADSNTTIVAAPNGVPVVNIANPNSNGLSNNLFTNYNVDSKGVVLNNGDKSQLQRQSQLGGAISANTNLTKEATVILNQVVSTNRSVLAGYTEVVGGVADVVVANPNGITCNGCGFINIPNLTLTTGVPVIASTGVLSGFDVNKGDILITGQGMDASRQDYIGLFARSLVIQGQINAKYLEVIAGANSIDYGSKTATAQAGTGAAPTLAIDSSVLGGMYAERIRLIATEAGVGVRMLGDVAAGAGDFTLTSSGKVDLGNKISVNGNAQVSSSAAGADAIKVTDASLSSQGNTTLSATAGEIHLVGSALISQSGLMLESATLTDEAYTSSIANNNKRYAVGNLTLDQSGAVALNGTSYGAGSVLDITAGSLSVGADGETIYGNGLQVITSGALALGKAALQSNGDISLTSTAGQISTASAAGQGIKSANGNIVIAANSGFDNAGIVEATAGNLTTNVNGTLHNTGTLYAKNNALLAGYAGGSTGTITNDGIILGDNTLSTLASTLTNNSGMQGTKGGTISATTLNNSSTGLIISSADSNSSGIVAATGLTNDGTIQSAKDLTLNVASTLTNNKNILAVNNLAINASTAGTLALLNNASGLLQAGGGLITSGYSGASNVNFSGNAGTVLGNTLTLNNLSSLSNTNIIQGGTGASSITVANTLTNSSAGNIKLGTTSAGSGTINASTLNNAGTIESKGALALNATSGINNTVTGAKIISDGNLAFRGLSAGSYTVANNGLMQSGGVFSIDGYSGAHAVALTAPSASALYFGNSINFNVTSVNLAGSAAGLKATNGLTLDTNSITFGNTNNYIFAGGVGMVNVNGSLSNNAVIHAQGNLNLTADSITNTGTGALSSNAVLTTTADNGNFTNNGTLYGNTGLNASSTNTLTNSLTGTIDSNGGGTITAHTFYNYNDINYAGNLVIDASYFYNQAISSPIEWSYWGSGFDPNAVSSSVWAVYGVCGKTGVPIAGAPGDFCNDSKNGTNAAVNAQGTNTFTTARTKIESEGAAWSGWNVWENTDKWYVEQSYDGSTTAITDRPLIRSNGSITIRDFQEGKNLGGVISAAGTLNVNGAGGGSTFENNALTIIRQYWIATWYDSFDEWIDGSRTSWYHPRDTSGGFYYNKRLDTSKGGGDGVEDIASVGATLYGGSVSVTGTALSNVGSVDNNTASGASVDGQSGPTTGTGGSVNNTNTSTVGGSSSVSFGGITITLPTNPNGLFIVNPDPSTGPLIETNPMFQVGSAFMGSDYMITTYGVDPDTLTRRLGDANYEAHLIQKQVVNAGASELLGTDPATAMQKMMDNGVNQGKSLGLTIGVAPTADQIANLKSDMVWMVETEVNGQRVLAPVVYLSAETKSQIASGAVIQGGTVDMQVTSLTNTGGTIAGTKSLNVTSEGDITNTSGTIKGGDVSLTSKMGNILNETWNKFTGDDTNGGTSIGKTGSIESTGNLSLDAKKDITNKGADMTAGGNANLKAGDNITFDTIVDKKAKTTNSHSDGLLTSSTSSTTESTSKNIGSNLKVGGNLTTDSGKDTTIRGSNVDVKGDGTMKAGGNLNILDAQDESRTTTTTSTSGVGVGGGVYGMEKETDDLSKKKSVGSNLKFGGNADLSATKDLTIQGSDLETGGDLGLKGDSVKILEGRNEETHTNVKETTTFLSVGSDSSSDSGTDTSYNLSDEDKEAGKTAPDAGAGAHANASATGSADLSLAKTTKTETNEFTSKAKGSNIKSGGNLKVESNKDTTVRGSNVEAAGDVDVNAGGNLNIEAAQDVHTKNVKTTETSIGFHTSSENKAEAGAQAGASADAGGATANAKGSKSGAGANVNAGNANADADASAEAKASSDNTLDLVRHTETETNTSDITHTKSTIKSGGNSKLKAKNDINVKGSDVEAGGDLDVDAGNNLNVIATEDRHETTTKSSKTSVGLYAEAGADAKAEAHAKAGAKTGAEGGVSGEANASAGIGLQGKNTKENSVEGSTTANTSSLKSGGNMSRKAGNKITDEGTQIEAGGDFTQESKEWESKAAKDTTWSSKDSEMNKAKLGLYAEAGAEAHASGEAAIGKPQTDTGSEAGASAGLKASYERETENESKTSSKAVTSSIKSGGKMKTTTTGKTSLEGTNLESGGDMEVNAGSLDYKAARDTETSSKGGDKANGEIKVGVDATKAVTGSLKGGYETESESESSSKAVVGSMKSGGKLKVNTKEDANFEGTNIESADDASVKSENGSVNFNAARDTSEKTSDKWNVEASISASKSKGSSGKGSTAMGFEAKGGMEHKEESESNAVTGSIKSGGKLDVSAKKNVTLEGTAVESKGDTTLDAGENVEFKAAKSTKKSEEYGFEAELKASKGGKDDKGKTKGTEAGLEAKGNYGKSDETTSTAGSMKSGGGIKVKSGKDTTFEGTNIESEGKTSVDAGGNVNFKAAEDTKNSIKVEAELDLKKEEGGKGGNIGGSVEGGKSNTKKAGSIKAGEIDVKSGKDTTLEGTNLKSKGDTSIDAGGNLNLNAAESTHIDGSFGGKAGSDGAMLKDAGIGGGVTREGSKIEAGGNLNLKSGGKTTMTGTKADVEGKATIDAKGGVEKKSAVSGGGQIGTSRLGAEIDVQKTNINAKGGVTQP